MLENITGEELKNQFKTNKKLRLITLIVGSAALLALGYFIYLQFVWTPKNEARIFTLAVTSRHARK